MLIRSQNPVFRLQGWCATRVRTAHCSFLYASFLHKRALAHCGVEACPLARSKDGFSACCSQHQRFFLPKYKHHSSVGAADSLRDMKIFSTRTLASVPWAWFHLNNPLYLLLEFLYVCTSGNITCRSRFGTAHYTH